MMMIYTDAVIKAAVAVPVIFVLVPRDCYLTDYCSPKETASSLLPDAPDSE